ncbi:hypothetical protein [uncultured Alistipes sp.]|uniref:hypothetical protein n=1 Tax=uncultured Alistipes sp. TaxID=538949 RepID=UPI002603EEED|nr:hypothetical protein [uncultured Alistipes sp.]
MAVEEIASIFHVSGAAVERHIEKIIASRELNEYEVKTEEIKQRDRKRCIIEYYNLDMIIALCFRIGTPSSKAFRRWITEQVVRAVRTKSTIPIVLQIHSHINQAN